MSSIATKTGDKGQTSLIGGERRLKSDLRLDAYGTSDELCSYLGYALSLSPKNPVVSDMIPGIQNQLFQIGAELACAGALPDYVIPVKVSALDSLESSLKILENQVPPMKSFILPGGSTVSSALHVCRCICRRLERIIVEVVNKEGACSEFLLPYINRLSDWCFIAARAENQSQGISEAGWIPEK
jgi:cob(I)alamin adenosyltransferase